jgi:hypothetical protein
MDKPLGAFGGVVKPIWGGSHLLALNLVRVMSPALIGFQDGKSSTSGSAHLTQNAKQNGPFARLKTLRTWG